MTAVNSKPADPRLAKRQELSTTDLRLEYMKHCRAYLIGTRDQLETEGIPEIADKWPLERALVRWEVDGLRFSMEEESRYRLKKLYGRLPEEPRYRVWIERSTADYSMWARRNSSKNKRRWRRFDTVGAKSTPQYVDAPSWSVTMRASWPIWTPSSGRRSRARGAVLEHSHVTERHSLKRS